jgi:transcriptional regulator with XRE-family HTH domain
MLLTYRLRKIRELKKLSQEDAAFNCGISSSAYGQIERNAEKSTYETLCKISRALDVSIHFLVDINNPSFIDKNKL